MKDADESMRPLSRAGVCKLSSVKGQIVIIFGFAGHKVLVLQQLSMSEMLLFIPILQIGKTEVQASKYSIKSRIPKKWSR